MQQFHEKPSAFTRLAYPVGVETCAATLELAVVEALRRSCGWVLRLRSLLTPRRRPWTVGEGCQPVSWFVTPVGRCCDACAGRPRTRTRRPPRGAA